MGSTTLVTNSEGDIIENMNGEEISGETTPFGDQENKNIFYTGKQWDEDAQLYYFNARWYDPETGRFITEDPIKDGLLWFAYCGNNPINYTDPTGLDAEARQARREAREERRDAIQNAGSASEKAAIRAQYANENANNAETKLGEWWYSSQSDAYTLDFLQNAITEGHLDVQNILEDYIPSITVGEDQDLWLAVSFDFDNDFMLTEGGILNFDNFKGVDFLFLQGTTFTYFENQSNPWKDHFWGTYDTKAEGVSGPKANVGSNIHIGLYAQTFSKGTNSEIIKDSFSGPFLSTSIPGVGLGFNPGASFVIGEPNWIGISFDLSAGFSADFFSMRIPVKVATYSGRKLPPYSRHST